MLSTMLFLLTVLTSPEHRGLKAAVGSITQQRARRRPRDMVGCRHQPSWALGAEILMWGIFARLLCDVKMPSVSQAAFGSGASSGLKDQQLVFGVVWVGRGRVVWRKC